MVPRSPLAAAAVAASIPFRLLSSVPAPPCADPRRSDQPIQGGSGMGCPLRTDLEVELVALRPVVALELRAHGVGAGLGHRELAGELAAGLADDLLLAADVLEVAARSAALELDLDLPAPVGSGADRARV